MWGWWLNVVAALGFTPTIVQGAYMSKAGGGASASAGYHDLGGCFDLRTWDLTRAQLDTLVRVLREHGAGAWRRDREHGGFDPHLHFVLGTDLPLAPGATNQWRSYVGGRDGLASNGPDYEYRPDPLITKPPPEDEMTDDDFDRIRQIIREETADAVDKALDAELNINDPKGDARFRGMSLRAAVKRLLAKTGSV
jgi:hypothetical protein